MKFLLKWLIGAFAFVLTAYILPGIFVESFYIALILAFIWGFVSTFIKPIVHIFALPLTVLTLGLFSLVVNGVLFWFVSTFIQGFEVDGFMSAVLGAFLVSVFGWAGKKLFISKKDKNDL